jgi:uncharacterized membrane protein (UPF0127 family)
MNWKLVVSFVAILAVAIGVRVAASDAPPSFPESTLTIVTRSGQSLPFKVEVARTPEQQEYGLMFRKRMDLDHGMIFIQPDDRIMTMWMKNTILPLDMLFFDDQGTITLIVPNATPESTEIISSRGPVLGVIELNAGVAKTSGITAGDHIASPDLGTK